MDLTEKRLKLTPKQLEAMHTLGLQTTEDVLSYYPYRYEILKTSSFSTWKENDHVVVSGEVVSGVKTFHRGRRQSTSTFEIEFEDQIFKVTIFNRPWARNLKLNEVITIQGIYQGKNRITALTYWEKPIEQLGSIQTQYSTKAEIKQKTIKDCVKKVFEVEKENLVDLIPHSYIEQYRLISRKDAIEFIHLPTEEQQLKDAYRTLKYEEFLRFFLAIEFNKNEKQITSNKQKKVFEESTIEQWILSLPFALTKDQVTSIRELLSDLKSTQVMNRILQGDVGSGKTIVAAAGLYACALSNMQGALLAPTEILAKQHYQQLCQLFENTGIRVGLLYSELPRMEKEMVYQGLEDGSIDIIVGTHSLFQEQVSFFHLGFVVADEQQRFGVNQRRALREKGTDVDFLLMSATPIPRTLASTIYGDMDVSTIETMPEGRKKVATKVIYENSFRSVLEEINHLIKEGRQIYVICAAIEKNEDYHARNVEDVTKALQKQFAGFANVGTLHGKLSSEEKQSIMDQFVRNQIQILVSTTVVEVGVNVVNATAMIIYDADRFGMSQLHQLRGRVQRGSEQGYCWLLTDSKDEKALERLQVLEKTTNGFEISYEDLRLRGPGDALGTRQSGFPDFILGNMIEDQNIIQQARKDALEIAQHPSNDEYQAILDWIFSPSGGCDNLFIIISFYYLGMLEYIKKYEY